MLFTGSNSDAQHIKNAGKLCVTAVVVVIVAPELRGCVQILECGLKSRLFPSSFMNNFICGCKPAAFKYAYKNRTIISTDKELNADKFRFIIRFKRCEQVAESQFSNNLKVLYGVKIHEVRSV